MLTIRQDQEKALNEATRIGFLERMENHVRGHFGQVVAQIEPSQLRPALERQWAKANSYGLASELGVCSWLNAVFVLGENFETAPIRPWAKLLLNDNHLPESVKIERLRIHVESALEAAMKEERT